MNWWIERALLLGAGVLALTVSLLVHEGLHVVQAWAGGEEDLPAIHFNPTRNRDLCDGHFACTDRFPAYDKHDFWMGEGMPNVAQAIVALGGFLWLTRRWTTA